MAKLENYNFEKRNILCMLPVPIPLQRAVCAQASFSGGRKAPISLVSVWRKHINKIRHTKEIYKTITSTKPGISNAINCVLQDLTLLCLQACFLFYNILSLFIFYITLFIVFNIL